MESIIGRGIPQDSGEMGNLEEVGVRIVRVIFLSLLTQNALLFELFGWKSWYFLRDKKG